MHERNNKFKIKYSLRFECVYDIPQTIKKLLMRNVNLLFLHVGYLVEIFAKLKWHNVVVYIKVLNVVSSTNRNIFLAFS